MKGASLIKISLMFDASRCTDSKVITVIQKKRQSLLIKTYSGRKPTFSDRNRWNLTQILRKDRKSATPKTTARLNDHSQNKVPTRTI